MKSLIQVAVVAAVLAVPAMSFAQTSQPVTRAQVRDELAQLEKAAYNPSDWVHYPENLRSAEAIVAQQNMDNTAYGAAATGSSQAGK